MTSTTGPTLSKNDLAVLGALFDPEASLTTTTTLGGLQDATPSSRADVNVSSSVVEAERSAVQLLNTPDPTAAQVRTAISQLSRLIDENPSYASAYTNRAQATRLLPNALTDPEILTSILSDLHSAIKLSSSPSGPAQLQLQQGVNRVLATAHSHRAFILLHASSDASLFKLLSTTVDLAPLGLPPDVTQSRLEELASQDFATAGRNGDEKARQMAVKTNPYAKLCGSIVREALREEIRGFYGLQGEAPRHEGGVAC